MSEFPELLDNEELENNPKENIPSVVLLEVWLFPIINILTYLLILSMYGIIFSMLLHFIAGVWQFFSFLVCFGVRQNPWRNLYKKLLLWYVATCVFGLLLLNGIGFRIDDTIWFIFSALWLFLFPHGLNWLYWTAARYDAKRLNPNN